MNKKDLTIILTGLPPVKEHNGDEDANFLENRIKNYKKYGKLIIQKWQHVDNDLYKFDNKNIKVINLNLNDAPRIYGTLVPSGGYQIYGIYSALLECKTEYVLKIRCDEYYEFLTPLIDLLNSNPNKIIALNIGWNKDLPKYICDHLYAGKTSILLKTFEKLMYMIENQIGDDALHSLEKQLFNRMLESSIELFPSLGENLLDRFDVIFIESFIKYKFINHHDDLICSYKHDEDIKQPYFCQRLSSISDRNELENIKIV